MSLLKKIIYINNFYICLICRNYYYMLNKAALLGILAEVNNHRILSFPSLTFDLAFTGKGLQPAGHLLAASGDQSPIFGFGVLVPFSYVGVLSRSRQAASGDSCERSEVRTRCQRPATRCRSPIRDVRQDQLRRHRFGNAVVS